jgi:hypothetical protein
VEFGYAWKKPDKQYGYYQKCMQKPRQVHVLLKVNDQNYQLEKQENTRISKINFMGLMTE